MTVSVWRYAHLALAVLSFLFLLVASLTGVILAIDAVDEKMPGYRVDGFSEITLSQSIPELKQRYPEIVELSVDHNQFVLLEGFDKEGNDFKSYIHPLTGEILGNPVPKTAFIQWTTALHRSLFLKETGRFIIGVVSFLLLLIVISGTILIIKRQQGIRYFFSKINKDSFAQYFHVVSGRLLLIPVFVLALTGTYLFLVRFNLINTSGAATTEIEKPVAGETLVEISPGDFPVFKETLLSDIVKVEFPFTDDPEEFFTLKLKDRELTVDQFTGTLIRETVYSQTSVWETLSLDLHTGRTHAIWAIILGIASLNIIFFIYSGFMITFKRKNTKISNTYQANDAEYILLTGSENGSTVGFANRIHQQMLADSRKSYITELNQYTEFPRAKQIIVFTSTYGIGEAPSNAKRFKKLVASYPQKQPVQFSVVGFGSKSYKDYCGYASRVDKWLQAQDWATRSLSLHTVNDKSPSEFVHWVRAWSDKHSLPLATTPALYTEKLTGFKKLKLVARTAIPADDATFTLRFKPRSKIKFRSGDLLAIYPANDGRERLYSIGKYKKKIELVVKLHEMGLGSRFLHELQPGDTIKARIISNPSFHLPARAPEVAMIANGTGIAPFLGMVRENRKKRKIHLYAGFRYDNETVGQYRLFAAEQLENGQLSDFQLAFSREKNPAYVMDLIRKDADRLVRLLKNKGVVMICGALAMQKDVEAVLDVICRDRTGKPLSDYAAKGQILTDCY